MPKKQQKSEGVLSKIVSILAWLTGIIVSLAVGFSMTKGGALNQSIPWLSSIGNGIIVTVAGWIVIVLTLLGVILAILNK